MIITVPATTMIRKYNPRLYFTYTLSAIAVGCAGLTACCQKLIDQPFKLCITDHIRIGVHIHLLQNMAAVGADGFNAQV